MKIRSRALNRIAATLLVWAVRALFSTCRLRVHCEVPNTDPNHDTGPDRYLYSIWHDQILMTLFSDRPRNMAGLVSGSNDGSLLALVLERLHITPIRGSSSRGGVKAMRQMLDLARGLHVAITPDGPRGPRREAKDGIAFLAVHAGRRIVPVAYACGRAWRIKGSWTDMLVPKPFTTLYTYTGPPLEVPPRASRDQLEDATRRLQSEMLRVEAALDRWMTGAPPQAAADNDAPLASAA